VPRNKKEHSQNPERENHDEHHLHNTEPISLKLLATTIRGSSTKSSHSATVLALTAVLAAFSAVLSSVSGNSNHSAAATNSRNIAAAPPITYQGQSRVQELTTQKHYPLLELSCPLQEAQLWSLKPRGREITVSDL
jgi:hypothetical protein